MKKRILSIPLSAAAIASIAAPVLGICSITGKVTPTTPVITPIQRQVFEIEGDTLKGFNSSASKELIKEYCKDGVLRLPPVKTIGNGAFCFDNTNDLPFGETITIDSSTTSIGERAFYGNTASSVTWTGGVKTSSLTSIGKSAFAHCSNLTSFEFPTGILRGGTVGTNAFLGCSGIQALDCTSLGSMLMVDFTNWSKGCLIGIKSTGQVKYTAPDTSSQLIGASEIWRKFAYLGMNPVWNQANASGEAYENQYKIVPDEYYVINDNGQITGTKKAWNDNFNYAQLPQTVKDLTGAGTIMTGKTAIKTWDIRTASDELTEIPEGFLQGATATDTTIIICSDDVQSNITSIGANAFNGCKWTISLGAMPEYTTSIGANAFDGSTITSWKFNNSVTIGDSAFANCKSLASLDFSLFNAAPTTGWTKVFNGSGATGTSANTFKIKTITSPTQAQKIDLVHLSTDMKTFFSSDERGLDFGTTSGKWSVGPQPSISQSELFDISSSGVLNGWAKDSNNEPLTATEVKEILTTLGTTELAIPSTVISIADNAFYDSTASTPASTIPDNVTKIDMSSCTELTSIGANAFKNLPDTVESIVLSDSITDIGAYAFQNLKVTDDTLTLPTSLVTIGAHAFENLPTSIYSIDFNSCSALETIGDYAFAQEKPTATGASGSDFSSCSALETIGAYAFYNNNNNFSTLRIPANITSIGECAFYRTGIEDITFQIDEDTSLTIGASAFASTEIEKITMENFDDDPTKWSVGAGAFDDIAETGIIYAKEQEGSQNVLDYFAKYSDTIAAGSGTGKWVQDEIQ